MRKKLLDATSSMKMMWVCIGIIAVAGILVASGLNFGYGALFLIPCMIMMGAMMWMMGGGTRGNQPKVDAPPDAGSRCVWRVSDDGPRHAHSLTR